MSATNVNEYENQLDIDKLIHEPARLKILAQLYVVDSADFIFIMRQTGLTQGNVSGHLNKLENAGYVEIIKKYLGKRPITLVSLSKKGRVSFKKYVQIMHQLFDDLKE